MTPKKSAVVQKKERAETPKKTAKKKIVKKTKKPLINESLSIPPIVNVEEILVSSPQTRSCFAILHDDKVYKTTTTILNRVVLVSSVAVYIIAFVLAGLTTFADTPNGSIINAGELISAGRGAGLTPDGSTANIGKVVAEFIRFFFGALGLAFLCYVFYAGFVWLTAAGEEDKVKKARGIIFHSILGLIVCAASFAVASAWISGIGAFVK